MARSPSSLGWLVLLCAFAPASWAVDKSPSLDAVQWLGTKTSLETTAEYNYIFAGNTDLGNGSHGDVSESDGLIRALVTTRCLRAFLIRGGVEWERFDFHRPDDAVIPQNLHVLDAFLATDFRFSRKDMIRIQARPGLYSDDDESSSSRDFNGPAAFAYSRIQSKTFQWSLGVSLNRWRNHPLLAGGGVRWALNDRWKLKLTLPEPAIEYKARDDLHLSVGGDFRFDSFRVSPDFGTKRGNPALNNALVDYQEIRAGFGASWNIRPLIELNMHVGYVLDRAFDYHNNGILLTSDPSPYISVNLHVLFEMFKGKEDEESAWDTKGKQFEVPDLERVLPNVPKVFEK